MIADRKALALFFGQFSRWFYRQRCAGSWHG